MGNRLLTYAAVALAMAMAVSCGTSKKAKEVRQGSYSAELVLPEERKADFRDLAIPYKPADTLIVVDMDGHQQMVMNAIRDTESGEMVASETLEAAVVTARFRNIAERHGKVDIEFQVRVPQTMFDTRWQLRFHPRMAILEDTVKLEDILVTGRDYRREQDRGYMRYRNFVNSIIQDSTMLVNRWQLELFIQRNIPELYMFKQDSSYVTDAQFESAFGVTEGEAVEHYTFKIRRWYNNWKKANTGAMYRRFVKSPYIRDNLRLDTVVRALNGDFIYNYIQTIETRPRLRKVDILLTGDIYEQEKRIYDIPASEPLTYYISSLSTFVDPTERYLSQVVSRRIDANTECRIDFKVGSDVVNDTLNDNETGISRIKSLLAGLLADDQYDLDSIVVAAGASPEGAFAMNRSLSERRSRSVSAYFDRYMKHLSDSLAGERGVTINLDETWTGEKRLDVSDIRFISHEAGENWEMLDSLVRCDIVMDDGDRTEYFSHSSIADPDRREAAMRGDRCYRYYKDVLYPKLRTVRFDFHLHRRGMVQDTVTTTVLDSVYMTGVQAIRDRDYETAVRLLMPYNDFNAAIAFCSLDRNATAMSILRNLERSAEVNYMMAILYSREGMDREAVECYLQSCQQNPSFVYRGNLDPEISALIRQYGLNRDDGDLQE